MNVTREVIIDLLPIYLAGEASPATRALIDEYLKQDPELAQRIRQRWAESLSRFSPAGLPPELELQALKRTRKLLRCQKWLFGLALFFAAVGLSIEFSTWHGRVVEFHFLVRDYPSIFGSALGCSVVCWVLYSWTKHRVRTTGM